MEYTNNAPLIGKAGELRVRSELMFRGISVAVFDFDDGSDMILKNGKKLQIKTSLKPYYSKSSYSWRYSFTVRQYQFRKGVSGKYKRKYTRKNYDDIGFFVFYCVKDNLFFIVPEKEIGEKVSFALPTPDQLRSYKIHKKYISNSKYEKYKDNWEILK